MSLMLLEVDPAEILVDERRFQPDLMESAIVYEHLLYCCSKSSLLPTIFIQIEIDAAFVIRGQWFLSIARDLNANRIRAIVDHKSDNEAVKRFLRRPSVTQIEWEKARKIEAESPAVEYRWLVFFFEKPLTEAERRAFESQICGFYSSLKVPAQFHTENERIKNLSYTFDGLCAEFQGLAPFGDESWYPASRAALEKFHREVVPVVSFQGYRVEF
jgi:hypothetical protein